MSKRDILKAMSINDMVKSIDEDKGEEAISWGELAELTHTTQVERFGFCTCEDNEGNENPYILLFRKFMFYGFVVLSTSLIFAKKYKSTLIFTF
jgi:hypothetical protein